MSLLFIDSFDYDTSDIGYKYQRSNPSGDGASISSSITRRAGAKSIRLASTSAIDTIVYPLLVGVSTVVVGTAFYFDTHVYGDVNNHGFQILLNVTGQFLRIEPQNDYSLDVRYANTTLASSAPGILAERTWQYIEVKVEFGAVSNIGTITVRLNETDVINYTGAISTGVRTCTGINLEVVLYRNQYQQDFYICDGSGTSNNDFLGDIKVEALRPSADGSENDFTPSTGFNYENVDEVPVDADATYNSSAIVGDRDLYNHSNIVSTGAQIFGVQHQSILRKDDADKRYAKNILKSSITEVQSTEITLNDTYTAYRQVFDEDPHTSAAWTEGGVDAVETGLEVTA